MPDLTFFPIHEEEPSEIWPYPPDCQNAPVASPV